MTEYAKLVVSVDSTQVKKAEKSLSGLSSEGKKTEAQAGGLAKAFKGLGSVLGTYLSLREVARASEEYTNLTNKLRQVTTGSDQLAYAQNSVMRVAQETTQSLSATASVYQRIAQNASTLGLTFAEVEQLTKTVSQTIALSGADAGTASGAMMQFGQALASGALRGDELNSILEGTPALAQAIARGMGVSVGELRKLGSEGKITSAAIVSALQNQAAEIDMMARNTEVTASQAATVLSNSFVAMVGAIDQATGASSKFAQKVLEMASAMDGFRNGSFADFFRNDKQTVEGLNSEISVLLSQVRDFQRVRNRLDRNDPNDTAFFKLKFWDRGELDAEIKALEDKIKEIQLKRKALSDAANAPGAQTPAGDAPAEVGMSDELLKAYEKQLAALQRQKSLHGDVTEAARISYEIQSGALQGLGNKEADRIMGLAQELDARKELTEQQKVQIALLRESGQLRAANDAQWQLEYAEKIAEYERQGNQEALQRLETLKKIREAQVNAEQMPGAVEGVSRAPISGGLDASIGGAGGELARLVRESGELQYWRETELEKHKQYLEAKAITEEEYARRVENIHQQNAQAISQIQTNLNVATLSMMQSVTGDLLSMMRDAGREQTMLYATIFLSQQALAAAQALIHTELAAASALAPPPVGLGPVAGLPYSKMIRAAGYTSIALIGAQTYQGLSGFATGGYTGPGGKYEPAGVVHRGEVVWSQEDIRRAGGVGVVEAMRLGKPGFYDGGVVDMAPVRARQQQPAIPAGDASSAAPLSITHVWQITPGMNDAIQAEITRMLPMITDATARSVQQQISRGGSMARSVGRR
jgi:tape measure domain-containing protein